MQNKHSKKNSQIEISKKLKFLTYLDNCWVCFGGRPLDLGYGQLLAQLIKSQSILQELHSYGVLAMKRELYKSLVLHSIIKE